MQQLHGFDELRNDQNLCLHLEFFSSEKVPQNGALENKLTQQVCAFLYCGFEWQLLGPCTCSNFMASMNCVTTKMYVCTSNSSLLKKFPEMALWKTN
jgi:hypothetical protein